MVLCNFHYLVLCKCQYQNKTPLTNDHSSISISKSSMTTPSDASSLQQLPGSSHSSLVSTPPSKDPPRVHPRYPELHHQQSKQTLPIEPVQLCHHSSDRLLQSIKRSACQLC